jgi:hypothetical protein
LLAAWIRSNCLLLAGYIKEGLFVVHNCTQLLIPTVLTEHNSSTADKLQAVNLLWVFPISLMSENYKKRLKHYSFFSTRDYKIFAQLTN